MSVVNGKCPKCGSNNLRKERIMGAQTMDLECMACKYSDHPSKFDLSEDNDGDAKENKENN